ncbi:MAG: 16S rRNA (uracil(1498)-N(3))-methyltransferase [Bacteroidales bacterium]|jgi:16S rRNA (uracil1498-N3)-methyltransferase|nr:16S rRNA (uracil(1498)-N(3))-methyltransferase [Bacteroidales bacterium]
MHLFFADIIDNEAFLNEEDSKHCVNVLRLRENAEILLTDGNGQMATCKIILANPKKVVAKVLNLRIFPKNEHKVHLVTAPTKNIDRFEFMLEKITEIGVSEITPIFTHYSERKILRLDRCDKVITAAVKQCQIPFKPQLNNATDYQSFLRIMQEIESEISDLFIAYCGNEFEKIPLSEALRSKTHAKTSILIGPEGDFSVEEVKKIVDMGGKVVSLSENRLRTETAGIVAAVLAENQKNHSEQQDNQ